MKPASLLHFKLLRILFIGELLTMSLSPMFFVKPILTNRVWINFFIVDKPFLKIIFFVDFLIVSFKFSFTDPVQVENRWFMPVNFYLSFQKVFRPFIYST